MRDEFATISLGETFFHTGDEAGLIFEHAAHGILYHLLGVLAVGESYLLEPRFDFG